MHVMHCTAMTVIINNKLVMMKIHETSYMKNIITLTHCT